MSLMTLGIDGLDGVDPTSKPESSVSSLKNVLLSFLFLSGEGMCLFPAYNTSKWLFLNWLFLVFLFSRLSAI